MKHLLLIIGLLTLAGCGVARAFIGPPPELVSAAPTIEAALSRDGAAHPEFKAQNDAAKAAMEKATQPGLPEPPKDPTSPTDWLLWGVASVALLFTGGKTAGRVLAKRKAKKAGASATAPPQ